MTAAICFIILFWNRSLLAYGCPRVWFRGRRCLFRPCEANNDALDSGLKEAPILPISDGDCGEGRGVVPGAFANASPLMNTPACVK